MIGKKSRKLQMNIMGKYERFWTRFFLMFKIHRYNLKLHEVRHYSLDHSELVVSGDSKDLWEFIRNLKKPVFPIKLDKIIFTFVD